MAAAWPTIFLLATTALVVSRVVCATSALDLMRAALGACALCVLLVMRRGNFARAATYAFAVECAGAALLFVFVDAPAIEAHVPTMVQAIVTSAR